MREPHYLTPYKTDKIPLVHGLFVTQTTAQQIAGGLVHKWQCGGAAIIDYTLTTEPHVAAGMIYADPRAMWEDLTAPQAHCSNVVIWSHQLSHDLRISDALKYLPQLGYTLDAVSLADSSAWSGWSHPYGKLSILDLKSWLPVHLNTLADDLPARQYPSQHMPPGVNSAYSDCWYDLYSLRQVTLTLIGWLRKHYTGPFRPTGSGQCHSMWRRNHLPTKTLLVHGDPVALDRERTAMWTGRAEAWRHGRVTGPLYEWDMKLAYCHIAAQSLLPVKLLGRHGKTTFDQFRRRSHEQTLLADVTLTTERETVPTLIGGKIIWPVGTFKTTLWDTELQLACVYATDVQIHRYWYYDIAPVLAPMAQWLLDTLNLPVKNQPPVIRYMLKHWARTLVGRCALRYRKWEDYATTPNIGLSLATLYDLDTDDETQLLHVGHRMLELAGMEESEQSTPQITSWIMARARRNLYHTMDKAGFPNIIYVDTDGLIVNADGNQRLAQWTPLDQTVHLEPRARYSHAVVYGPRNIRLANRRKLSGIPRDAIEESELEFTGDVWQTLESSLLTNKPGSITVTDRKFRVTDHDPRRQRTHNGMTEPYRLDTNGTV